jgi:glycosyltransferase involved in cell wall biosynthesis
MRILILTKRQYMNKDLLDDRYGRFREIPLALGTNGHKVKGVCLSYAHKNEGWIKDGPVFWKSINATPLKLPGLLQFINVAYRFAKKSDVIWACSDSFYGIIGYLLSSKCHIPLVFDLYDNFEYYLMAKLPVIKQLYRQVVKKSDAVTCVSRPLSRLVKSYGRKSRVNVLENGIREDLFIPMNKKACRDLLMLPKNSKIIGTAGTLASSRGTQILFEVFDSLKTIHLDLHLALAGPRESNIPTDNRIHDLGVLPFEKVPLLINALDVAIVCNQDNEFGRYCFPQKAREIMACNVPLIATDIGSMAELFKDYPEWLFTPDDANDLSRVLENRLHDQRAGYGDVPSWSDIAAKLETIFLEVFRSSGE